MEGRESKYKSPIEAPLQYLKEIIQDAPERIKREYAATTNTWISCFITILTVLKGRMQLNKDQIEKELSPEGYQRSLEKLEALIKQAVGLHRQYTKRDQDPPQETKRALLDNLNIFE